MKYSVDVFTPTSVGSRHPENSYDANDVDEVARIIHNCTRKIAGVRKVEVWINEPDDRESVKDPFKRCGRRLFGLLPPKHNWHELQNTGKHSYQWCANFACSSRRIVVLFPGGYQPIDRSGVWSDVEVVDGSRQRTNK